MKNENIETRNANYERKERFKSMLNLSLTNVEPIFSLFFHLLSLRGQLSIGNDFKSNWCIVENASFILNWPIFSNGKWNKCMAFGCSSSMLVTKTFISLIFVRFAQYSAFPSQSHFHIAYKNAVNNESRFPLFPIDSFVVRARFDCGQFHQPIVCTEPFTLDGIMQCTHRNFHTHRHHNQGIYWKQNGETLRWPSIVCVCYLLCEHLSINCKLIVNNILIACIYMRNHFSAILLVSTIKTRGRKTNARINEKYDRRKKNDDDDDDDDDDSTSNFVLAFEYNTKIKVELLIATHHFQGYIWPLRMMNTHFRSSQRFNN